MSVAEKKVYMVAGPTAVGKTAFAIRLAQALNTHVISADSRQFYKEMSIGTAVPSAEELAAAPHHFVQHLSIHQDYNVHRYEQEAVAKAQELLQSHDAVVVVGGSGLYLNAFAFGIDNLPDPSPETRAYIEATYRKGGVEALRRLLFSLDKAYYHQMDIANPNRLKRAIEVCLTTGKTFSELRLGEAKQRPFQLQWIGLYQDRERLYQRINLRVDKMLEAGLMDEVNRLYPFKHLNALNTVGYKEFFTYLDGTQTYEWAVEKVKTNSRRYAKRQMTWFRKNTAIQWLDVENKAEVEGFLSALR